jgi:hypothetical protein
MLTTSISVAGSKTSQIYSWEYYIKAYYFIEIYSHKLSHYLKASYATQLNSIVINL